MAARTGIAHKLCWLVLTATATLLLLSGTAVAQMALSGNAPVPGTGIPFGATGLTSPGLSPAPGGIIGYTGTGTTCSAVGSSSLAMSGTNMTGMSGTSMTGMSGTSTTYDGGGIGMGASSSAGSATCGTSSGVVSMVPPMSPSAPGGATPAGIPLGSFEINSLGVSPTVSVPTPTLTMPATLTPFPSTMGVVPPTMGASILPSPIVGTGMPCSTTGSLTSITPSVGC
jgi:hypothetical protein